MGTLAPPPPQYAQQMQAEPGMNASVQAPVPTLVPWLLLPATEVNVDLHQCVAGNKDLFKSAWKPVWNMCSKMARGDVVGASSASARKDLTSVERATGEGAE